MGSQSKCRCIYVNLSVGSIVISCLNFVFSISFSFFSASFGHVRFVGIYTGIYSFFVLYLKMFETGILPRSLHREVASVVHFI